MSYSARVPPQGRNLPVSALLLVPDRGSVFARHKRRSSAWQNSPLFSLLSSRSTLFALHSSTASRFRRGTPPSPHCRRDLNRSNQSSVTGKSSWTVAVTPKILIRRGSVTQSAGGRMTCSWWILLDLTIAAGPDHIREARAFTSSSDIEEPATVEWTLS